MSENKGNVIEDQDLLKALEDLGISTDEINTLSKAKKSEDSEEESEKKDEGSDDDYEKMKADIDEMEKACSSKKAALEEYMSKKNQKTEKSIEDDLVTQEKKEEINKSETSDLLKSLISEAVTSATKESNDLVKSLSDGLKKTSDQLDDLKSENSELKKSIEEIGSKRPGMKSLTKEFQVIEKGESVEDKSGRTVVNVSNKEQICDILEKAIDEESKGEIVKSLENELMNFNCSADGKLSEKTASYLFNKKNVRLVK